MFTAYQVALGIGFEAAQARLVNLAFGDGLLGASRDAYDGSLEHLVRVGPLGCTYGASKLVRVRFVDPVYRDDAMTLGLRWEATGIAGGLFPALDADITLTPAGAGTTKLALAGSYRPPLGRLGAGLDKVILNQVAAGTIRTLLRSVASALLSSDTAVGRDPETAVGEPQRLIIEPETPA